MLAQPSYLLPDMEGEALPDPLFGQTPTSFLCETAQFSWRGGIIGEDQDFSMIPQHSRGTQHRPRAAHSAHIHPQRSEEHTSELQSLMRISYAVFCLKKKKTTTNNTQHE